VIAPNFEKNSLGLVNNNLVWIYDCRMLLIQILMLYFYLLLPKSSCHNCSLPVKDWAITL